MAVDKNLFVYNLAVVAIMKNEGPYVKEWLDYHLLAGVNHFYIYDNESPDNLKEVLQPYIAKGFVTYIFYPGKARQYEAYNEASQNYKFLCRYMAFIDGDEFIFPQTNRSIVEVLDEIFSENPKFAGLGINMFNFGSNFQEKADYSRGVMERFTRRTPADFCPTLKTGLPGGTAHIKTVANPRKVDYFYNSHFAVYYETLTAVNENGQPIDLFFNNPPTVKKIVINHYCVKSHEEYLKKCGRGTADAYYNVYKEDNFAHERKDNEVFDDSILKYRDARRNIFESHRTGGDILETFSAVYKVETDKIFNALIKNLSPIFALNVPKEFLQGKLETFLTCRAASKYLREKIMNEKAGNFFEEMSIRAIYFTLSTKLSFPDLRLLLAELPNILKLNYPAVGEIRNACLKIIPQLLNAYRVYDEKAWKKFVDFKYLMEMLQTFDFYTKK